MSARARSLLLHSGIKILVFQKVYLGSASALAREAKSTRVRTVFIMGDLVDRHTVAPFDHVVVVSDYWRDLLIRDGANPGSISVIPDPIETDSRQCKDYSDASHAAAAPTLVWVGNRNSLRGLDIVRRALEDETLVDYRLTTISDDPEATIRWTLDTVFEEIVRCDIAVIPVALEGDAVVGKSENRLVMFKALGLPVICSPLPAYTRLVTHGQNGLIAETVDEWIVCLRQLRHRATRQRIGLAGRDAILRDYSTEAIAGRYEALFDALTHPSGTAGPRTETMAHL